MIRTFLTALVLASFLLSPVLSASAATADWQYKGASLYPTHSTDFSSDNFKQSVRDLKAANANNVTLIIPYYQSNLYSTDIARGWNTPTDESLAAAIDYVHSQGMKVMLKPHLESYTYEWRANINPGDRDTWFRNYGAMLRHYARIAQDHGVDAMCVGAELISMSTSTSNGDNTWRWQQMIKEVRAIYSGKLTYSANWGGYYFGDEKNHIDFWGDLDYIGVSAYFNLWGDSVQSYKDAWNHWNWSDIKPLADRVGKPVIFTEIGYRSVNGSPHQPWDYNYYTWVDPQTQANAYEALFSYWNDHPYMTGAIIWDWRTNPNEGGQGDPHYTPQNKPAEETMRRWWAGGAVTPPPTNPGNPAFEVSGSAAPSSPNVGQNGTVSVTVKNTGSGVSNTILDIEIYKGADRVFQHILEGQNIGSNETKNFSASWTPSQSGEHTVKVGLFSNNWSSLYSWHDPVTTVNVASGGTTTPAPEPTAVDIWWPTNGSTVSGNVPFKAAIYDRPLSDYKMYWQVDGDRLNEMFDDQADYPHKEALVDLSGWNWKESNSYLINFVAKTLGGDTIAEKSTTINVSR